jgi:uncharacterized RDD family membrane protein YckC
MTIVGDATKARLIAVFIDHFVAFGLVLMFVAFVPETLPWLKGALFFAIYIGYFVVLEGLWSRTVGKYVQGLVIRKLDGSPCDWRAAFIRSGFRIVEVNPLLFGGLPAGLIVISNELHQRFGDIIAGTLVVPVDVKWDPSSLAVEQE